MSRPFNCSAKVWRLAKAGKHTEAENEHCVNILKLYLAIEPKKLKKLLKDLDKSHAAIVSVVTGKKVTPESLTLEDWCKAWAYGEYCTIAMEAQGWSHLDVVHVPTAAKKTAKKPAKKRK